MNRKLFVALILLFVSTYSFSQTVTYSLGESLDFFRSHKMQTGDWKNTLTESDIEGSPYLNDEFIKGSIYTTSKTQFADIQLRYNVFKDQLEFKTPDDKVLAMAAPEVIEKVEFGEYKMVYIPYVDLKKIHRGFFHVLVEGKSSLFARSGVVFKEATEAKAYQDPEPAKFEKKPDTYYIRIGQEQARRVTNKKEVINVFPEHQEQIEAFVKKNKIKMNKSETLVKVVEYYNSL